MTGFQAYQYYLAVKLHFTNDKFDVFDNPHVKYTQETFEKRNDKLLFEKLSRKYPKDHELIQFFVSNFAYGHNSVVYEEDDAKTCLFEWNKRRESITRVLEDDTQKIILFAEKNKLNKEQLLYFTKGEPPVIFSLFLGEHISIESVRIIDDYFHMIDEWRKESFISLWEDDMRRIYKLKRFVKYNKERVDKVINQFTLDLDEL